MLILGWHGRPQALEEEDPLTATFHDAAAVLLRDGVVIAAIEEERLSRHKHTRSFPARAIRFCLAQGHATLLDVDAIVTDVTESGMDEFVDRDPAQRPHVPFSTGRDAIVGAFEREFAVDVTDRLQFCNHHVAHLCSAVYPSGFSDGMAITLDGSGDHASGVVATFGGESFRCYATCRSCIRWATLPTAARFLGYQQFDEYKAMGLSPYGDPSVYSSYFRRLYTLLPQGRFEIIPVYNRLE